MDSSPDDFVKTTRLRQPLRVTRAKTKKKPAAKASTSVKNAVKLTESTSSKVRETVPVNQMCPCCREKVESDFSVHVNFCLARFSKSDSDDGGRCRKNENNKSEGGENSAQNKTNEHTSVEKQDNFNPSKASGSSLRRLQSGATKKNTKKRKEEDEHDAELQLALAMSASLSQRGDIGAPQTRKGKDKHAKKGETLLKFRSKDSRKAVITERLGMVLMESCNEEEIGSSKRSPTYCSPHLNEFKQPDSLRWKLAGESLDDAAYQEFYVGALRDFVIPQSKPYQPQFRSWSQIPGRERTLLSQQILDDSDDEDSACTQDVLEDLYDISGVHSMLQQTLKNAMDGPESPDEKEDLDDTIDKENQPPEKEEFCEGVKKEASQLNISSDEEIVPCSTQKSNSDSQTLRKCTISFANVSKKLTFGDVKDQPAAVGTKDETSERSPLQTKTSTPIAPVSLKREKDGSSESSGPTSTKDLCLSDTILRPSCIKEDCLMDSNDDTILVSFPKVALKPTTLFSSASDTDSGHGKLRKNSRLEILSTKHKKRTSVESKQNTVIGSPSDNLFDEDLEISDNEVQASESSQKNTRVEGSEEEDLPQSDQEELSSKRPNKSYQKNIRVQGSEDEDLPQSDQEELSSKRPNKSPQKNTRVKGFEDEDLPQSDQEELSSKRPNKSPQKNTRVEGSEDEDISQSDQEEFSLRSPKENPSSKCPLESTPVGRLPETLVEENLQMNDLPKSPQDASLLITSSLKDRSRSSSIFSDETEIRSPTNLDMPIDSQSSLDDVFEKSHSESQRDSETEERIDKTLTRKSFQPIDNEADVTLPCRLNNRSGKTKARLLLNWHHLWVTKQHTDIFIKCKDKKIPAHSLVLKAQGGKLWEKCWNKDAGELDLSGWQSFVVNNLLCAIYSGEVTNEIFEELSKIAEEYSISALMNADERDLESSFDVGNRVTSNVLQNKVGELSRNYDEGGNSSSEIGDILSVFGEGGRSAQTEEPLKRLQEKGERYNKVRERSNVDSEEEENTIMGINSIKNAQGKSILSTEKPISSPGNASLSFFDMDADSDDFFLHSPAAPVTSNKGQLSAGLSRSPEVKTISEDSDIEELVEIKTPVKKRRLSSITSCSPTSNLSPLRASGDGSFYNPFDVEDTSDEPKAKRSRLSVCDQMLSDLASIVVRGVSDQTPEVLTISSDDSSKGWEGDRQTEAIPKMEAASSEEGLSELHPFDRSTTPNCIESRLEIPSTSPHVKEIAPEGPVRRSRSGEEQRQLDKSLFERLRELEAKNAPDRTNEDIAKSTDNSDTLGECKESGNEIDADDVWGNPDWEFDYEDHFVYYDPEENDREEIRNEEDNDVQEVNCNTKNSRDCISLESDSLITLEDPQVKIRTDSGSSTVSRSDPIISSNSADKSRSSNDAATKKTLENEEKMAVDDLNLEDSILWRAENEPLQTPAPKKKTNRKEKSAAVKITPLPDYKNMATPTLKKELGKYGLKQLSRKQATKMLSHIYEQLHPVEPKTPEQEHPESDQPGPSNRVSKAKGNSKSGNVKKNTIEAKEKANASSDDESSDGEVCLEETFRENENDFEELTQTSSSEVSEAIWSYVRGQPRLHENILQYEPIWLDCLHTELKEAGIKCKMAHLMALFDNECIIYRIGQQPRNTNRRRKKKASPKKNQKKTKSNT